MIVPWRAVAPDTLRNLIEEYVTRDGTDYGEREVPLDTRVEQVMNALRREDVVLWFDEALEEVALVPRDRL